MDGLLDGFSDGIGGDGLIGLDGANPSDGLSADGVTFADGAPTDGAASDGVTAMDGTDGLNTDGAVSAPAGDGTADGAGLSSDGSAPTITAGTGLQTQVPTVTSTTDGLSAPTAPADGGSSLPDGTTTGPGTSVQGPGFLTGLNNFLWGGSQMRQGGSIFAQNPNYYGRTGAYGPAGAPFYNGRALIGPGAWGGQSPPAGGLLGGLTGLFNGNGYGSFQQALGLGQQPAYAAGGSSMLVLGGIAILALALLARR